MIKRTCLKIKSTSLFKELSEHAPKWWELLKQDKEIYIEIRKDGYMDAYYNGGAIVKELRYSSSDFKAKIHAKYLGEKGDKYTKCPLDILDEKLLEKIKKIIREEHYPQGSEKGIQAKLIGTDGFYLDSEFQYDKDRIDLVWLDVVDKKIIFQELKHISDARLLKKIDKKGLANFDDEDILRQMQKYEKIIEEKKNDLLEYFKELFKKKKELGILSKKMDAISDLSDYTIEGKPKLLIVDYEEPYAENSRKAQRKKNIESKLKKNNISYSFINLHPKITIHRGINQIGGCITEIATDTSKILIDLGHNLPKGDYVSEDIFASKNAIEKLTRNCNAIFYTHYHGDHVDLFKYVPMQIPQYIGETAKKIMQCKYEKLSKYPERTSITRYDVELLNSFQTFRAKDRILIGDIIVTPYFVSHSACDAYMFLIEAAGIRILHTGDFRGHGYLGSGLMKILDYIVQKPIDVLITEGTMLSRIDENVKREFDLQQEAVELMKEYKYVFVLCSSTDVDRLATFYQASTQNARSFLCDEYQKEILEIFASTTELKSEVYRFDKINFYKHGHEKQLKLIKDKGFCMLVRSKHIDRIKDLIAQLPKEKVLFVYSMWGGYLNEGIHRKQEYVELWKLFVNREELHTSGHATAATLAEVCKKVNPVSAIIPIHSEFSQNFDKLRISDELKNKIITKTMKMKNVKIIIQN